MKRTMPVGLLIMFLVPPWLAAQQASPDRQAPSVRPARLAAHVEIAPDSRQPDIEAVAGDTITFTLTARDDDGAVVDDWSSSGTPITIHLENSIANVDTSEESWTFDDPIGYSFADVDSAIQISVHDWSIPPAMFSHGVAMIRFVDTRAERGVTLRVWPGADTVRQVSARMNFRAGPVARFLVEITSQTAVPSQVYHMRHYEVVVIARDRFQNAVPDPVATVFSARFPGEFNNSEPDVMRMFGLESSVAGPTSFLIMSRIARPSLGSEEPQYIIAGLKSNLAIRGRSDPYEILRHDPVPFPLASPPDHSIIAFQPGVDSVRLAWIRQTPPDPFTNIQISRYNPVIESDTVRYTALLLDSASLSNESRIPADMDGTAGTLTLSKEQVIAVVEDVSRNPQANAVNAVWCVEAGDGLSKTYSTPPNADPTGRPGYRIHLVKPTLASGRMQLAEPWTGPSLDTTAGATLVFTLHAKDLQGMDITRWDSTGYPVDITLNSTANTDTSEQSWSADPDDYTYARLELAGSALALSRTGPHGWSIPPAAFAQGSATLALTCNKAESGVTMTLSHGGRRNPWQTVSKPMNFAPKSTAVERPAAAADAQLFQNYPNPVLTASTGGGTATIAFTLRRATSVTLKLHSLLGAELATLVDGELAPGEYRIPFDARRLPPGVYVYTLRAGGVRLSRTLTLLR